MDTEQLEGLRTNMILTIHELRKLQERIVECWVAIKRCKREKKQEEQWYWEEEFFHARKQRIKSRRELSDMTKRLP